MAFICTVDDATEINVFRRGNAWLAVAAVGFDPEEKKDYSVAVGLEPAGGDLEYYFNLIIADNETGTEDIVWDGKYVHRLIDKESRKAILNVILAATRRLLQEAKPERFFRCTYEPDLPDRALEKHERVTEAMAECGYLSRRADPYHGKRIWIVERVQEPGVASDEEGGYDEGEAEGRVPHGPPASD